MKIVIVVLLALAASIATAFAAVAHTEPPAGDRRPVAVFIGDSDASGAGSTSPTARWTSLVSSAMRWREVNFARRSTGYATSSSGTVCGQQICPPYADLIDQVAAIDPDVVVVSGGQSDWRAWRDEPDRTRQRIAALLTTLRHRVPDSRIVVVGPAEPPDAMQYATVQDIGAAVGRAALARKLTYVDLLAPNVLADGDDVAANRFDPDDSGHRAIADRVLEALR